MGAAEPPGGSRSQGPRPPSVTGTPERALLLGGVATAGDATGSRGGGGRKSTLISSLVMSGLLLVSHQLNTPIARCHGGLGC